MDNVSLLKNGTLIFVIGILLVMLTGCTTTKYIDRPYPVPEIHNTHTTDTVVEKDSVYVHDSTSVSASGDTVYIDRWHTVWRDRGKEIVKKEKVRDSIPYEVEVEKPYFSEKEMPLFKKIALKTGYLTIFALCVCLIIRLWKRKSTLK